MTPTMTPTATLTLDSVVAGYGRVQVLRGVTVAVAPGEVIALIGPNGAGKSTLLRAATGMIPITGGSFRMGDRDLTGAPIETIARAGVAHVPEGRRLFAGLTVRDNLLLGGWHGRNTALDPVLQMFPALGSRLRQVAGSLSGGEQQMCAIGRALMSQPHYLLVDELSLGLAPSIVDDLLDKVAAIAATGCGVLLVEQDAGAALEVAHRGYVLENGAVTLQGPAAELGSDKRVRAAYLGVL